MPKIRPDAPEIVNGVLEVDKLKIELFWKIDEDKMKQIAAQQPIQDASGSGATTSGNKTGGVSFNPDVNVVQQQESTADWEIPDESAFGDEKNCGACTMLNPMDAKTCSVCGTAFP